MIEIRYPQVESITTDQLSKIMSIQQKSQIENRMILLDIRSAPEFAVSHIKGAIHLPLEDVADFAERELSMRDKTQLIVVYCSVGMRSADAAEELKILGFTRVKNLQGSLFKWANEDRVLEGGRLVHAYNAYWGQLLKKDLRHDSVLKQ